LIERVPHSFRYRVTVFGFRAADLYKGQPLRRPCPPHSRLCAVDPQLQQAFNKIGLEVNARLTKLNSLLET
jgi:hypothetical protein